MGLAMSEEMGTRLLDALGLTTHRVTCVTLVFEAGEPARLCVESAVPREVVEGLIADIAVYELLKREAPAGLVSPASGEALSTEPRSDGRPAC